MASLSYYTCKTCKKEVPVRTEKNYGYCRYCGNKLAVTELMKKYHGMTDAQIYNQISTLQELMDVFNEKCDDDFGEAIRFLLALPESRDDPELCYSAYRLFYEKMNDVLPEDVRNQICLHFLNGAAATGDYTNTYYVEANKKLAAIYRFGSDLGCKEDRKKACHYYYALAKNPQYKADSFYSLYLLEEDRNEAKLWLEAAARAGHPKAQEKLGMVPEIPCAYFNSGVCTLNSTNTVLMHCYYFKEGRAMAACPDYKIAP